MVGSHSEASLLLFWWQFTLSAARVRLRMSVAKRIRVARSRAHSLESWASLTATMCSMSVSDVEEKQVPVQGP